MSHEPDPKETMEQRANREIAELVSPVEQFLRANPDLPEEFVDWLRTGKHSGPVSPPRSVPLPPPLLPHYIPGHGSILRAQVFLESMREGSRAAELISDDVARHGPITAEQVLIFGLLARGDRDSEALLKASKAASRAANKGHALRQEAREWVRQEWLKHRAGYADPRSKDGNKRVFSEHYAPKVKGKFDVVVKPDTIRNEWLHGL